MLLTITKIKDKLTDLARAILAITKKAWVCAPMPMGLGRCSYRSSAVNPCHGFRPPGVADYYPRESVATTPGSKGLLPPGVWEVRPFGARTGARRSRRSRCATR